MNQRFQKRHTSLCLLVLFFLVSISLANGCTCSKKTKKSRSGTQAAVEPTPEPTPEPTDQTAEEISHAGIEIDPITTDKIATLDTNEGAQLYKIPFATSGATKVGRQLTEFLIVIRANEKSCVRLKARPTSGLSEFVEVDKVNSQTQGYEACGEEALAEEAASLNLTTEQQPDLEYGKVHPNPTFGLAEPAVCATRLFRMGYGGNVGYGASQGLDSVSTKTARLAHIGSKVRIWIDEEYSGFCDTGGNLDTQATVDFGPLIGQGLLGIDHTDLLWKAQVENLAGAMDTIVTQMTTTFGPISDIDSSGKIEIFLSPDVNRKYFIKQYNTKPDHIRSAVVYRPEDLAYYDSTTNPLSNEGEVLYLWVPDPAGIFNYSMYPSANSIASNYAKGYLAAQAMTLIIANQRLLINDTTMEEEWLTKSLAYLTSAYYGGNDFTVLSLGQYLTSRPQNFSLTEGVDSELVNEQYSAMAWDEHAGFTTMFGWYLHTRLCGNNVTPCAGLVDLIQTANNGKANIEAVTGTTFGKVLEGFGASVGSALADSPATVRALWAADGSPESEVPLEMPSLTEISASSPPTTVENQVNSTKDGGSAIDRTSAGPFPSLDALIYQPILPDNDMDLKLAKDSVTYLLITGMVEEETIITAFLGKGLNVTFVPVGDRDPNTRQVYTEKLSEGAHLDLRPINFTTATDPETTYYEPPAFGAEDYTVTTKKDFWILGSIDNFNVNEAGAEKDIGDSDSYNIPVEPCKGLSGAELATCAASDHEVIVQLVVREFSKELTPMLVVTSPDIGNFRGHALYARTPEIDPEFASYTDPRDTSIVCQSESSWATRTVLTSIDYDTDFFTVAAAPADGVLIQFTLSGELPSGVKAGRPYIVLNRTGTTFQIAELSTPGTPIDLGHYSFHYLNNLTTPANSGAVKISNARPGVVSYSPLPDFANDDTFTLTPIGVLPSSLDNVTTYFVANVNTGADTFQISTLAAGAAIQDTEISAATAIEYFVETSLGSSGRCANGSRTSSFVYDNENTLDFSTSFAHIYDNFLFSSPKGYPYFNTYKITHIDHPDRDGMRSFIPVETERQFLKFSFDRDLDYVRYADVFAVSIGQSFEDDLTILHDEAVSALVSIKEAIDSGASTNPQSDTFVDTCTLVSGTTEASCTNAGGNTPLQGMILGELSTDKSAIVCYSSLENCIGAKLVPPGPITSGNWVQTNRFFNLQGTTDGGYTTFYKALEPESRNSFCGGDPDTPIQPWEACELKLESISSTMDIREQLHIPASNLRIGSCAGTYEKNTYSACIDYYSWKQSSEDDWVYQFSFTDHLLSTDRNYGRECNENTATDLRYMPISVRAGEVFSKPERIHALKFTLPSTGPAASVFHALVGGLDKSQGKYLLRVRVRSKANQCL